MKDQNPRTIGPEALVDARNWIYRDGVFSVRPGVGPLDPGGENLFRYDWLSTLDMSTFPFFEPPEDAVGFPGEMPGFGDPMSDLGTQNWYPFADSLQEYQDESGWISAGTWQAGDPPFLNHVGTGEYLKILQVEDPPGVGDHYFMITSPVTAARPVPYKVQFRIAGDSVTHKVYARLCGFRWKEPIGDGPSRFIAVEPTFGGEIQNVFTYTGVDAIDHAGWTDVSRGWVDNPAIYLSYNNSRGHADWVALVLKFDGPVNSYWGIANVMLYEGTANIEYKTPTGYWTIGQRPMGMVEFEENITNPMTVVGTSQALWVMENDFTFSPITDGSWSIPSTNMDNLVCFRTFDGDSGKVLLAVNGNAKSLAWDGSGPATIINGTNSAITAKCLAVCFNRVLYGNVSGAWVGNVSYPDGVWVSPWLSYDEVILDPAWIARLADTPGPIVAMLEMGNMQTAIYKTDCIYMAIGQGMDPPFRFELRTTCAGPASPLSVVSLADGVHAYLSNTGDVIIFDGVRPHSMGQYVQAYIQSTIDFNRIGESFGFFNKEKKELYFFYPPYGGSQVFNCVMINMSSETNSLWPLGWQDSISIAGKTTLNLSKTIGQLVGSIGSQMGIIGDWTSLRPAIVLMDDTGGPLVFEGTYDWRGGIDSYLQTGAYDLGEQTAYKTIHEIDHIFHADPGQEITVDILVSDFGKEQLSDSPRVLELDPSGPRVTRHRSTGRMFSLRMSATTWGGVEWLGSQASITIRGQR